MNRKSFLRSLAAVGAAGTLPGWARAQDASGRPVKLVVGVPAGGTIDAVARLMAERLTDTLKVPVVVDNRAGASGGVAADAVAAAEPDGQTLLVAFPTLTALPVFSKAFRRDVLKDFSAIGLFARTPFVLFAGPRQKAENVQELVRIAARSPGQVSFGSADATTRLAGELFAQSTDVELLHVPYKGGAPMVTDIAGGVVDLGFLGVPSVLSMHKAGRVRILAAASPRRLPALPDVPTLEEQGVKGFGFQPWVGLLGPAGMRPADRQRLQDALRTALAYPGIEKRMRDMGIEPEFKDGAAFRQLLLDELRLFRAVAQRANIQPE